MGEQNWSPRAGPPRFDGGEKLGKPGSSPATGARERGTSPARSSAESSGEDGSAKKPSSKHLQLDLSQVDARKPPAMATQPIALPGLDKKKKFAGGGRLRTLVVGQAGQAPLEPAARRGLPRPSFATSAKFAALQAANQHNTNRFWTEMKFQHAQPEPRTLHSSISFDETLHIYGGTDIMKGDLPVNELWHIQPLIKEQPKWTKLEVNDSREFCLPDGIKRHQMAV